jgi:hypothetical protein
MKIKKNGKIVNLTESDLHRIVKRVLNENNPTTKPTHKVSREDGWNQSTTGNVLYFVKKGDTYTVFIPEFDNNGDWLRSNPTNYILPKSSDVGFVYNYNGDRGNKKMITMDELSLNHAANIGNEIANLILPDAERSSPSKPIIFTNSKGEPQMSYLSTMRLPINTVDNPNELKFKGKNLEFKGDSYFKGDEGFGLFVDFKNDSALPEVEGV